MKYIASPISSSLQFQCGEDFVFYHDASGSIHLFNASSMRILDVLSKKPLSRDELIKELSIHDIPSFVATNDFIDFAVEQGFIEEISENETK